MMKLKLVATTKVFKNIGSEDLPMWRCIDGSEYIVARFDKEPTWQEVGQSINKVVHYLEGKLGQGTKEIYSGFELYDDKNLTHAEFFQLENAGSIDFPAEDITSIDVTEQLDGLQGI